MSAPTTIFDVLNARYSTPDKIARSFIAPSQFKELMRAGNSVLVGARGTGKTTLLKMLKLSAFRAWERPDRDDFLPNLTYISAFVSNDRNWSSRINDFASQFESPELQRYARLALVSNQALRAIVKSVAEVLNNKFDGAPIFRDAPQFDSLHAEIQFSQRFSTQLLDGKKLVSTADLEHELGRRVDKLIEDTNAMRSAREDERTIAQKHRWIFSEFLAPLHSAVSYFREATGLEEPQWCLCFEERIRFSTSNLQPFLLLRTFPLFKYSNQETLQPCSTISPSLNYGT
jgi:hypothetical protein